jgi:dihydropteroate synthase
MGILNVTPDSFYDGNKYNTIDLAIDQVRLMVSEGMDILDIGAASSRPGAERISPEEEWTRLSPVLAEAVKEFPDLIISVDTFWAEVAEKSINMGASIINDISAFEIDKNLLHVIAETGTPYILMHMQGTPDKMQLKPAYEEVTSDVMTFFADKIRTLHKKGIYEIILDPGFGFGKSIDHNYELVRNFNFFKILEKPLLAGISRKSMIYKFLNITPPETLEITTALHLQLLLKGAKILRVHDVKPAKQAVEIANLL